MVTLEEKISFMMSKFRDLIIKAALILIKKKHEKECPFGSSMDLSAKIIEKEPSKLETTKFEEPLKDIVERGLNIKFFGKQTGSATCVKYFKVSFFSGFSD